MDSKRNQIQEETPALADRESNLASFEKLESAFKLIEEAIKEQPRLQVLQIELAQAG
jgi:hypothetical protein